MISVITAAHGSSAAPTLPGQTDAPKCSRVQTSNRCGREIPCDRQSLSAAADPQPKTRSSRRSYQPRRCAPGRRRTPDRARRPLAADAFSRNAAEHPFGVKRRRQTSRPLAVVAHRQAHQLDRIVARDEHQHILIQPATDMRVARVALTVADGHRCAWSPRQGRGCPHLTRFLVAQVDHLARRVRSRDRSTME